MRAGELLADRVVEGLDRFEQVDAVAQLAGDLGHQVGGEADQGAVLRHPHVDAFDLADQDGETAAERLETGCAPVRRRRPAALRMDHWT